MHTSKTNLILWKYKLTLNDLKLSRSNKSHPYKTFTKPSQLKLET